MVVPTGLAGAEQALLGGGQAATGALLQGAGQARQDVLGSTQRAIGQLRGAGGRLADAANINISELRGAEQGLNQNFGAAQNLLGGAGSTLQQGGQQAQGIINQRFDQGINPISGFVGAGQQAQNLQAALTGALGPEAQAQAIADYQQSPGQQYAMEQAERALTRNAAAIGGLGGGNVRRELQRQAIGMAQQDFNNRIAQLSNLSGQGLQAASTAGQLRGQQGQLGANIARGTSQDLAGLAGQRAGLNVQQGLQGLDVARNVADIRGSTATQGAQLSQGIAQLEQQTGMSLGQLADATGRSVADIVSNIGQTSAGLRTQAGRDLANAIQSTTSGLSGLQAQQGAGLADIVGQGGSQLSSLLLQQGLLDADAQRQLGTLLANIGVEGATNQAALASQVGQIQAAGVLGKNAVVADAITKLGAQLGESGILDDIFGRGQK